MTLPTISASSLASAGQTAGSTPFSIPVKCDSGVKYVRAYFESGATTSTATGNLNPQSVSGQAAATNVQIALRNEDGSAITIGDRRTMQLVTVTSTDTMPLNYSAAYYATGAATAGVVQTYVTYTLEMP